MDQLLKACSGIMIGRGDLLLHIDYVKFPYYQRMLIEKAKSYGKECICGTEFLENFATTGVINRPELTDVSCAILQGCDRIMLSMESANSSYPQETIKLLNSIIESETTYDNV